MSGKLLNGSDYPAFVDDILYVNVATADFSPIEDPSPSIPSLDAYKGFLVRPQADGNFYGITYTQWVRAGRPVALTALVPVLITVSANQWLECPMVKIFAANDATYPCTANPLNIGVIH